MASGDVQTASEKLNNFRIKHVFLSFLNDPWGEEQPRTNNSSQGWGRGQKESTFHAWVELCQEEKCNSSSPLNSGKKFPCGRNCYTRH